MKKNFEPKNLNKRQQMIFTTLWGNFSEIPQRCQPFWARRNWFSVFGSRFIYRVYPYTVFYIYFLSEEVNGSERSNKNWMILEMGKEIIVFISTVASIINHYFVDSELYTNITWHEICRFFSNLSTTFQYLLTLLEWIIIF